MSHAFNSTDAQADAESLRGLIRRALGPGATAEDLTHVERQRTELREFLAEVGTDRAIGEIGLDGHQRLAAFYSALSGGAASDTGACSAEREALLRARHDDARAIGTAFAQVLLADLPRALRDFDQVFGGSPPVSKALSGHLLDHPSTRAAEGTADGLARFGLTPSLVARSMRALRNLARRWSHEVDVTPGEPFRICIGHDTDVSASIPALPSETALRELKWSLRLPAATASDMRDWLCRTAAYKPLLFDGFRAERVGDGLCLRWTGVKQPDLFRRWASGVPDLADE